MASTSGQRDYGWHYFTSKTPHFFKVLLDDDIQHGKLKIPEKFIKEYGSGISSPVFLKVPSGSIWQVELTKSNGEIWLQSGWTDFVQHHSLKLHDFVVFQYEGDRLFNVVIFDKSASEIDYPINGQSKGPTTIKEEHDETCVEIWDNDMPTTKKRKGKSPLPCSRPSRKRRIHSNTNGTESNASEGIKVSKLEVPKSNGSSPFHTRGNNAGGSNPATKHRHGRMQNTIRGKERDEALQRASSFKSQNPFFTVVIQPSYVTGRYSLPIPVTFAREYLINKLSKVLCVVDGKSWCMELIVRKPTRKTHLEAKLSNGWMEFLHDNKLDVGDVCVFELVESTNIKFEVAVFRSEAEDSLESPDNRNGAGQVKTTKRLITSCATKIKGAISSHHSKLEAQKSPVHQGEIKLQLAYTLQIKEDSKFNRVRRQKRVSPSNFASDYPNFRVHVRSSYLGRRCLDIVPETRPVTLQVAERSWHVQLITYRVKSCLTKGWFKFAEENSVKVDDICVFELVNRTNAVLRVSIFKHAS
ncbi:hypothetical protein PTKIN_Ptkin08bG0010000 [Pterospermum kingtungense]